MREVSAAEREKIEKRRREFTAFMSELNPVLSDFAERLGLANPQSIVAKPDDFIEPIGDFMRSQEIADEDRAWTIARMGCFIGQVLVHRFDGEWMLNEHPESRFFLGYVVGRFPAAAHPNITMDSFEIAMEFVRQPPGRELERTINEAIEEFVKGVNPEY